MSPLFTRVKPFLRFLLEKVLVFIGIFIFSSCLLFILPRLMPSNLVELMVARTLSGKFATGVSGDADGASAIAVREEIIKVLREVYTARINSDDFIRNLVHAQHGLQRLDLELLKCGAA